MYFEVPLVFKTVMLPYLMSLVIKFSISTRIIQFLQWVIYFCGFFPYLLYIYVKDGGFALKRDLNHFKCLKVKMTLKCHFDFETCVYHTPMTDIHVYSTCLFSWHFRCQLWKLGDPTLGSKLCFRVVIRIETHQKEAGHERTYESINIRSSTRVLP